MAGCALGLAEVEGYTSSVAQRLPGGSAAQTAYGPWPRSGTVTVDAKAPSASLRTEGSVSEATGELIERVNVWLGGKRPPRMVSSEPALRPVGSRASVSFIVGGVCALAAGLSCALPANSTRYQMPELVSAYSHPFSSPAAIGVQLIENVQEPRTGMSWHAVPGRGTPISFGGGAEA